MNDSSIRLSQKLTVLVALALPLAACSDDKNDDKGGKQSAALGAAADGKIGNSDPDTSIDALNSAEWKAACADMNEATDARELVHGKCVLLGLTASILGGAELCQISYDACAKEPGNLDCDAKPPSCPVTLREADECMISQLVWMRDQAKDLTCKSPVSELFKLDQDYMSPECVKVEERCPALTADDEEDTTVDWSDFEEEVEE